MSSENKTNVVPPELRRQEIMTNAFQTFAFKSAVGLTVSGLASLVLFSEYGVIWKYIYLN